MGVNSLPKTATREHRDCDLNTGPSAPESSMLTTRLLSHRLDSYWGSYLSILKTVFKLHRLFQNLEICEIGLSLCCMNFKLYVPISCIV